MTLIYGSGKYKHGLCHVFALGLHHIFGYQIAALEDRDHVIEHNKYPKGYAYIPHVFCIKNGYIIDAIGVRKPIAMIRGAGKYKIERPKIHKIGYRTLYNGDLFNITYKRITKKDVEEAEKFILRNKSRYTV